VKEEIRQSSRSKKSSQTLTQITQFEDDSRIVNEYYQPPPPIMRRRECERENAPREIRVDLPHFHRKEHVEAYLDWVMKA